MFVNSECTHRASFIKLRIDVLCSILCKLWILRLCAQCKEWPVGTLRGQERLKLYFSTSFSDPSSPLTLLESRRRRHGHQQPVRKSVCLNWLVRKWMVQSGTVSRSDTLYTATIATLQWGICQPYKILTSQDERGNGEAAFWRMAQIIFMSVRVSVRAEKNGGRVGEKLLFW